MNEWNKIDDTKKNIMQVPPRLRLPNNGTWKDVA